MKLINNVKNKKQILITHEELRSMLANELKESALNLVKDLFKVEITEQCSEQFQRKNTDLFHRAGTNPGSILIKGQRVKVIKPRVKHNRQEVELNSYKALQSYDILRDRVMGHMLHGVSTRDYNKLIDEVSGGVGLSKSAVVRVFGEDTYIQRCVRHKERNIISYLPKKYI